MQSITQRTVSGYICIVAWSILWLFVSFLAVMVCIPWQPMSWVVVAYWLVATIGLIFRWGWFVFGAVFGYIVAPFLSPVIYNCGVGNAMNAILYPVVTAIVGAFFGVMLDDLAPTRKTVKDENIEQ